MTSLTLDPPDVLTRLAESEARLAVSVGTMEPSSYAAPSLLPGWTRSHVIAHLALNAEGLAAAVGAAMFKERRPMYATEADRDHDIEVLAACDAADMPARLQNATASLAAALDALTDEAASTTIERTPGSERRFAAGLVPLMRWREVEIHHADLGLGYTPDSWPTDFAAALVSAMVARVHDRGFHARASDVEGSWQCGAGGPVVSGPVGRLAWWLTGRGSGEHLTSDSGVLPQMEAW